MATRYSSVAKYTWRYSEELERCKRASLLETVVGASSWRRLLQGEVAIAGAQSDLGSTVVLGEMQRKSRKRKVVNFAIADS